MKKVISVILLGVCLSFFVPASLFSQSRKHKKNKKNNDFAERLWYGGSFGLGLSNSTFGLNVSPLVGYKLTNNFSTGVRLPLDYTYAKLSSNDGSVINYNNLDYGLGTFVRHKLFKVLFAHAEYNYLWTKEPVSSNGFLLLDPENPDKLLTEKVNRDEFNIGLGYSSGGRIGTELMLLYNVLDEASATSIPWSVRVGFNYKF